MELWFSEKQGEHTKFSIACKEQLLHMKTAVQEISVLQSMDYGKVVVIDGKIMMSEKDEFIYHEMLVHPSFMIHPKVERVLVIGLGSGHILREIVKHDVHQVDVVERDEQFMQAMKNTFTEVATYMEHPAIHLIHQEPLSYLRNSDACYDVIIMNAMDHEGWNEILFTKECYESCFHALKEDGIFITQQDSIYHEKLLFLKRNHQALCSQFTYVDYYQAYIPTYPSGQWLFGMASKKYGKNELQNKEIETKYYNNELHHGAFLLPNNMKGIFK